MFRPGSLPDVAQQTQHDPPPLQPPPPLPRRLADPVPVVVVGTSLWLLGFLALLVARLAFHTGSATWMWTCLAGAVLGVIGYGIFRWQRAAVRRGARGAQQGL
jgi:hypothetical protein